MTRLALRRHRSMSALRSLLGAEWTCGRDRRTTRMTHSVTLTDEFIATHMATSCQRRGRVRILSEGSPMRRREFVLLLGGVTVAWPVAAAAQQSIKTTATIGFLDATSRST